MNSAKNIGDTLVHNCHIHNLTLFRCHCHHGKSAMNYNRVHGDHVDLPPRGIDVQKVHIRRVLYGKNRNSSSYLVLAGFTVVVEKTVEGYAGMAFSSSSSSYPLHLKCQGILHGVTHSDGSGSGYITTIPLVVSTQLIMTVSIPIGGCSVALEWHIQSLNQCTMLTILVRIA